MAYLNSIFTSWSVAPNWFWANFWPSLVSTIAGIGIGLPFALWVNSKSSRATAAFEQADELNLMRRGLKAVSAALKHNHKLINELIATTNNQQAKFDTGLDTSAWNVSREQICRSLENPDLQRRIAFHFSKVETLTRLNVMYLDMFAGIAAAVGGVEITRAALKTRLIELAEEINSESTSLNKEIEKLF